MVLCVWGFPHKVAALQFEHAWQHPGLSRHVRGAVTRLSFVRTWQRGKFIRQKQVIGVKQNVQIVLKMLSVNPYRRMPLRLHVFDHADRFQLLPPLMEAERLTSRLEITQGSFEELEKRCAEVMAETLLDVTSAQCALCLDTMLAGTKVVRCPGCDGSSHISCAAQVFRSEGSGSGVQLLPDADAQCPKCGHAWHWRCLVSSVCRLVGSAAPPRASEDATADEPLRPRSLAVDDVGAGFEKERATIDNQASVGRQGLRSSIRPRSAGLRKGAARAAGGRRKAAKAVAVEPPHGRLGGCESPAPLQPSPTAPLGSDVSDCTAWLSSAMSATMASGSMIDLDDEDRGAALADAALDHAPAAKRRGLEVGDMSHIYGDHSSQRGSSSSSSMSPPATAGSSSIAYGGFSSLRERLSRRLGDDAVIDIDTS